MARIIPKLLKGFRDYLPDTMIARRHMINTVSEVFERFGFAPLDTPALEYSEVLLGKYGEEAEKLLYRFKDNGDRDVCMRYDLTVPLARVVAMNRNLPLPFKRYQVGTVWRAENPGRGRFREFVQCDADVVGTDSLLADAECIAVISAVMDALDVDVSIRINNRKVFRGLQEVLAIDSNDRMARVLRVIDKLDKVGTEGVRKELKEAVQLEDSMIARILSFCAIRGSNEHVLDELAKLFASSEIGRKGSAELRETLEHASSMGVSEVRLQLDPSIARGSDYYTGTVYETFINGLDGFGSVMSGGRYDDLIGVYSGEPVSAVGVSVGLDRLLAGLQELGKVSARPSVSDVLITVFSHQETGFALGVLAALRRENVAAEMYLQPEAKMKKQFKYADALGIPLVVIAGPQEAERGVVSLRVMSSGEQMTLTVAELVAEVRSRVGTHDTGTLEYRTWGWLWKNEMLAKVPNLRGVYILRASDKSALEAGFAATSLRATLMEKLESTRSSGVETFDWYETGDAHFGAKLAVFLEQQLVRSHDD